MAIYNVIIEVSVEAQSLQHAQEQAEGFSVVDVDGAIFDVNEYKAVLAQ